MENTASQNIPSMPEETFCAKVKKSVVPQARPMMQESAMPPDRTRITSTPIRASTRTAM